MKSRLQSMILRNGKASLDVEADILKLATTIPEFQLALVDYFQAIWEERNTPPQWSLSRITPIWKRKGSVLDPKQYRGISVGPILAKVGMNMYPAEVNTLL